jgi:hypothetical protein
MKFPLSLPRVLRLTGKLCLVAMVFVRTATAATEIDPLPRGAMEIGSTNMEIVAPPADHPIFDYLIGKDTEPVRYLTDLLRHPESALVTEATVPEDNNTFGKYAGRRIPLVLYVVYPTTPDNPRPSYQFPYKDTGDNVFPHMQRKGEKPILAGPDRKYPVVFYSSGYNAHGLWDLARIKFLASHGYIVVSVFQGDGRFGLFDTVTLRPLIFRRAMDYLLAHPDFAAAIDMDKIGVYGSSMGGYTILTSIGAETGDHLIEGPDTRIKAGFALVPFVGAVWRHPFGWTYSGLKSVRVPFFAICGEKDTNCPQEKLLKGLEKMSVTRSVLSLAGEEHLFSDKAWPDVQTWEVLFFDAWLKNAPEARNALYSDTVVRGGASEIKVHQRLAD